MPSSFTQSYSREVSSVTTSQETPKRNYSAQERYRKTEKGRKAHNEASKRWNRKHRKYQPKGISRSDGVRLWWQRRKQQLLSGQQQ